MPRAIFQFNPGSDHCTLEGFELSGAHNSSHNGAGVRINQANHVSVRSCSIHDNDMGIMSNGDGSLAAAVDQRIEECRIYRNGDPAEPGQNHNLYLGGTSVTLRFCEIHHSLTGHNVKSRAHYTRVEYCYVHHSANREFDLVDAAETARPESDAVLLGNIIVKDPKCNGNHAVIHFGQDGGRPHDGTLYLTFNTIVTPFVSPVVELSTAGAKARFWATSLRRHHQAGQQVAGVRGGAPCGTSAAKRTGSTAVFPPRTVLDTRRNRFLPAADNLFLDSRGDNYRLMPQAAKGMRVAFPAELLELPPVPGLPDAAALRPLEWQYHHPAGGKARPKEESLTAGAYAGRRVALNARSPPLDQLQELAVALQQFRLAGHFPRREPVDRLDLAGVGHRHGREVHVGQPPAEMDLPSRHALPEPPHRTDLNADFLTHLADDRGLFRLAVFDAAARETIGQRGDHVPGAANHQHAAFPHDDRHRAAAAGSFGNRFHEDIVL